MIAWTSQARTIAGSSGVPTPSTSHTLARFPKARPPLPEPYRLIYAEHYKKNRDGATKITFLSMRMEKWLHRVVAEDVLHISSNISTLEIGAGTLNQLSFEPKVSTYDIVEPFSYLYQYSSNLHRVRQIYSDISEIPGGNAYSRITSIASFEHITNLPEVVARAVLLLEENGSLRASIPNEGTLLWRLGTLITGFEFRRLYNLDYQILMNHEHVNTAAEIETILKYFFARVTSKSFGISRCLSFYRFFHCTKPLYETAGRYLKTISGK